MFSTYAKRPLPSLHLKVVHTHWLKLFNFQLFRIVSFYKSLHYVPYFLQTLHNFCIISRFKSLLSPINTELTYLSSSSSGLARWQNTSDAVTIPRTSCSVTNCFFTTTVTFRQSRQTVCPQRVPLLFEGSRMTFDVLSILMVFCKCPSHTF